MRPNLILFFAAVIAFLLVACAAETPGPSPTFTPAPTSPRTPAPPTPVPLPQRAPVLRVALLGDTTTTNVWSLFDQNGTSYWNAATQASYWPSLYHLAPPSLDLQPATAEGELPPVLCDNTACTATVSLRPGITWTDGSAFSAADVVFTINTILQFQLGLNWQQFYNPSVLDHAEALDERTVRLYFKTHPTVADWQYGVLLGPVVNREYWQPRISDAVAQLPDEALLGEVQNLETELADMQAKLSKLQLTLSTSVPGSIEYVDATKQSHRLEADLIGVSNSLEKKRTQYEAKLAEARSSLYMLDNSGEPSLGPWKFAGRNTGILENLANLDMPLSHPWFDHVRYVVYSDEAAAVEALFNNQVDLILSPSGLSPESISSLGENPQISLRPNLTRSGRFLGFNHANPYLADPVLHKALACMLDPSLFAEYLGGEATPLTGFVLDDFWMNKNISLPCAGEAGQVRLTEATRLLKAAGYSWEREPASGVNAVGLKAPDGNLLPSFRLLVAQKDPVREIAAHFVIEQAKALGFSIKLELQSSDELIYAVYGSRDYDMVLLGWHLSLYPSYLCDWFPPSGQNPFAYNGSSQQSACEAWLQVNDLDMSRKLASDVQAALVQDLPFIPLYANVRVDAYRNIRYPFSTVIDGLGGLYGATELAIPNP